MKKVISLIMVFMLMTVLLTQVAAAELAAVQSKISSELMSEFSSLGSNETTLAYVVMQDVDHDAVMAEFARRYPEEYAAYMAAKTGGASPLGTASTNEALLQRALELKRAVYRDFYLAQNQAVISEYVQTRSQLFVSAYSSVTILELDRSTALSLARSDAVISVSECLNYAVSNEAESRDSEDPVLTEANMPTILASINRSNLISRADYLRDTKNLTGSGVKIGIIEDGVPDPTNPYLQDTSITIRPGETKIEEHTTLVAMFLAAVDEDGTKYGLVPNAQLYCADFSNNDSFSNFEDLFAEFYSDIEWMLSSGVNIINASMHLAEGYDDYGTYETISEWVDHIAAVHDVHFVSSAGNNDYKPVIADELTESNGEWPTIYVTPPAMAYNAIAVGGFWAKSSDVISKFTMKDSSGKYLYSYKEKAGTRPEKPNLVANGYIGACGETSDDTIHGTSFAAPQVTGVIAQLCCWDGNLKFRQNVVGAVLAASAAEKVDSLGTGAQGDVFLAADAINDNLQTGILEIRNLQISDKEGAGILDARWAWGILANNNYWNIIRTGAGQNETNVFYEKTVTINTNVNDLTRIAIFWTKNNTNINHTNNIMVNNPSLTNFNLRVLDSTGREIASSTTAYSNFEIVQFKPEAPGVYTIRIEIVVESDRTEYVGLAIW